MEKQKLEEILRKDGIWLGWNCSSYRNEEAFIKSFLDSENYIATLVEDRWAHLGIKSVVSGTNEKIYLVHKPTEKVFMIDGDTVETSAIRRPRYSLISLDEKEGTAILKYGRGEESYEKKFQVEITKRQIEEVRIKPVE